MFAIVGEATPLTQKVISADRGAAGAPGDRRVIGRRGRRDRDAVPNEDRVIADQNLLDDESDDSLPFQNVERVSAASRSRARNAVRVSANLKNIARSSA